MTETSDAAGVSFTREELDDFVSKAREFQNDTGKLEDFLSEQSLIFLQVLARIGRHGGTGRSKFATQIRAIQAFVPTAEKLIRMLNQAKQNGGEDS